MKNRASGGGSMPQYRRLIVGIYKPCFDEVQNLRTYILVFNRLKSRKLKIYYRSFASSLLNLKLLELKMDGNAYKWKYELDDLKSIKEFIFDKLRLNKKEQDVPYTNQSTGNVITITRDSAKEIAGH
jgi:hypothetical protein